MPKKSKRVSRQDDDDSGSEPPELQPYTPIIQDEPWGSSQSQSHHMQQSGISSGVFTPLLEESRNESQLVPFQYSSQESGNYSQDSTTSSQSLQVPELLNQGQLEKRNQVIELFGRFHTNYKDVIYAADMGRDKLKKKQFNADLFEKVITFIRDFQNEEDSGALMRLYGTAFLGFTNLISKKQEAILQTFNELIYKIMQRANEDTSTNQIMELPESIDEFNAVNLPFDSIMSEAADIVPIHCLRPEAITLKKSVSLENLQMPDPLLMADGDLDDMFGASTIVPGTVMNFDAPVQDMSFDTPSIDFGDLGDISMPATHEEEVELRRSSRVAENEMLEQLFSASQEEAKKQKKKQIFAPERPKRKRRRRRNGDGGGGGGGGGRRRRKKKEEPEASPVAEDNMDFFDGDLVPNSGVVESTLDEPTPDEMRYAGLPEGFIEPFDRRSTSLPVPPRFSTHSKLTTPATGQEGGMDLDDHLPMPDMDHMMMPMDGPSPSPIHSGSMSQDAFNFGDSQFTDSAHTQEFDEDYEEKLVHKSGAFLERVRKAGGKGVLFGKICDPKKCDRFSAGSTFFQVLVLASRDKIVVDQRKPFSKIRIFEQLHEHADIGLGFKPEELEVEEALDTQDSQESLLVGVSRRGQQPPPEDFDFEESFEYEHGEESQEEIDEILQEEEEEEVVVKPKRQRKKGKKRRSESAAATPDAFEGSQDAPSSIHAPAPVDRHFAKVSTARSKRRRTSCENDSPIEIIPPGETPAMTTQTTSQDTQPDLSGVKMHMSQTQSSHESEAKPLKTGDRQQRRGRKGKKSKKALDS